jgi:hypothetical protein
MSNEISKISRRDFLKLAGMSAGAWLLTREVKGGKANPKPPVEGIGAKGRPAEYGPRPDIVRRFPDPATLTVRKIEERLGEKREREIVGEIESASEEEKTQAQLALENYLLKRERELFYQDKDGQKKPFRFGVFVDSAVVQARGVITGTPSYNPQTGETSFDIVTFVPEEDISKRIPIILRMHTTGEPLANDPEGKDRPRGVLMQTIGGGILSQDETRRTNTVGSAQELASFLKSDKEVIVVFWSQSSGEIQKDRNLSNLCLGTQGDREAFRALQLTTEPLELGINWGLSVAQAD